MLCTCLFTGQLGGEEVPELDYGVGIRKSSLRHNSDYIFRLIGQEEVFRFFEPCKIAPFCFNGATRPFGPQALIAESYSAHVKETWILMVDFSMNDMRQKLLNESKGKYHYHDKPPTTKEIIGEDSQAGSGDFKQEAGEPGRYTKLCFNISKWSVGVISYRICTRLSSRD